MSLCLWCYSNDDEPAFSAVTGRVFRVIETLVVLGVMISDRVGSLNFFLGSTVYLDCKVLVSVQSSIS